MKKKVLGLISIAMATVLVACAGGKEESVVSPAEVVAEAAEESTVEESAPEDQPIYTVVLDDEKKDYSFEEIQHDFWGFYRYIFIHNGKAYLFVQRTYPEDDYRQAYMLGITDLETKEYKEVAIESELEELCKNYSDDLEGYAENGDSYFEVVPDETGAHEWLKYYSDENENAFIVFKNFGVDKEGNVFALVRFCHTYWGDGQLNDEAGDYELLKWSPDGEFILPRDIFGEDEVSAKLADADVLYDSYDNGYDSFRYYEKNGDEYYGMINSIGMVDDKQFVGVAYDVDASTERMGIFTAIE